MGRASRSKKERRLNPQAQMPASVTRTFAVIRQFTGSKNPHPVHRHLRGICQAQMYQWDHEPVVLRFDDAFAGALATTDPSSPIERSWASRSRFGNVLAVLDETFELHDGIEPLRYHGFLGTGYRYGPVPDNQALAAQATTDMMKAHAHQRIDAAPTFTWYPPLHADDLEGVRFLWFYTHHSGDPGAQTITVPFDAGTVGELIDGLVETVGATSGAGAEVPTLASVGLQVLAWLAAATPDLDALPAPSGRDRLPSPSADQSVPPKLFDAGFRIGADLRSAGVTANRATADRAGAGGWQMPPHVRSAHFHRVRIATRDDDGRVVGDVHGSEGADWHYELRWYPPTLVNAERSKTVPVTVRSVAEELRSGRQQGNATLRWS